MATPSARLGNRLHAWTDEASPQNQVNVGEAERVLSALGGGALAIYGLTRGTLSGLLLSALGGGLLYRGATGSCSMYRALGISTARPEPGLGASIPAGYGVRAERAIVIQRSPEELYRFWRDFDNLPRFLTHIERVQTFDEKRSHWVARTPFGLPLEWNAEIINERPNELLAWRSLRGAAVDSAGSIHFRPVSGGRATEVRVNLKYDPPGGQMTDALAWLFGEDLDHQLEDDLRRLRQMMETGETATVAGPVHRFRT
jgi:uncharacterized membrane protein